MKEGKQLLSDFKFYSGSYSMYNEEKERYETWEEAISGRVMKMHRQKYYKELEKNPKLEELFNYAEQAYLDKLVLGSQRALQFGGKDILKHHSKMYNCLTSYADRLEFFNECMYWLLSGCGVGFRVLQSDIDKLPQFKMRTNGTETYEIDDSIEGWADAIAVLLSSYVSKEEAMFPRYSNCKVRFDYSKIRPKGTLIAGRFKAPGPDGLRNAIDKIERLLDERIQNGGLRTIDAYDMVMHMSDAVLSGGVRRSATICLFGPEDNLMINAKTGNWFVDNPQRARSNNSVMLLKKTTTESQFKAIVDSVKAWGEPGFVWVDSYDIIYNPCVEIGMYPQYNGTSGWQGCNLTEINGSMCHTREDFFRACRASAILGTLQAGYTDFKYVSPVTKQIFDREALLGCSITGFANSPELLFNEEVQRLGATLIKDVNKKVARLLGINQAARTTCVKPSGNASVLLQTASGIHGDHSERYFRNVQVNKTEDIAIELKKLNPDMFEDSIWSANNTDWVVSFPVETKEGSLYKKNLLGVNQLELVKKTQKNWVEYGTNPELCVIPEVRHNVSNTINVDNWDEVATYIYLNRQYFAGISLLSASGDKDYTQAPFTAVYTPKQILKEYGHSAVFASGLIVDGLHAFNNDLWSACNTALGIGEDISVERTENLLKRDWVRRIKNFAKKYLDNDLKRTTYLLKDVHNYHKWVKLTNNIVELDWANLDVKPQYTDIDTMGSVACSGDQCEITF